MNRASLNWGNLRESTAVMEALESSITCLPALEKRFVSFAGRPKKRRAT